MSASGQSVAVLGAGSWGTALAAHLASCDHDTVLWGRDSTVVESVKSHHLNQRYLPDIQLPSALRATTELDEALQKASTCIGRAEFRA